MQKYIASRQRGVHLHPPLPPPGSATAVTELRLKKLLVDTLFAISMYISEACGSTNIHSNL